MESKKYGVWAVRSAASIAGPAEAWLKEDGIPLRFGTMVEAAERADKMNAAMAERPVVCNVRYYPKEV